ncbi:MAG: hypothetical protein COB67_12855 [SAR324 cluster bacterium]|uniref:Uncharacterized protein n=1 Tax=SAR324 cluster bacterium TaxID=2024889 RepID=A0A2A4SPT8_9DELT|nr:MAG: hypothetical protein COB67_12855 [SAR324 cluster bacterium]
MKGFFYGLTAGLAAGVVAQMMIAKNHEQMLELVKNIPRPIKFGPASSLEDLLAQKETLEEMIIKKQTEVYTEEPSQPAEETPVSSSSEEDLTEAVT